MVCIFIELAGNKLEWNMLKEWEAGGQTWESSHLLCGDSGGAVAFMSQVDPSHCKDSHGTLNTKRNETHKQAPPSMPAVACLSA